MRHIFTTCLLLFAVCLLISCGGPAERIKETAAITPTPSPTPGERDISGNFLITGAAANDIDPYTGSLSVVPKGDNYEFRWATTKGTRVGTGVQMASVTAVSFATTGAGKGCGVVLYKVDTVNGIIDGRSAEWGNKTYLSHKGTRTFGNSFPGHYKVTGKGTDGREYSDTLTITKNGEGYLLVWFPGENSSAMPLLVGFGTWRGSYAAASFGGPQCSFALYDIQSNGSLEGTWGGQKQVTFGTETAKRQ